MHYINDKDGLKLLGMGTAVVIAVQTGTTDVHQVRIKHPDFGDTAFIPYIQTSGILKVPAINDVVYVFCNEGFHNYPMVWGTKLHDSAVQALLGSVRNNATVIYSTGADNKVSHTIILDDGSDRGVRIKSAGGNSINIKNDSDITISQVNGNTINLSNAGINLTSGSSSIILSKDSVKISAGGSEMTIGAKVEVKAADKMTTVDEVIVSQHKHTGNLGYPTSPPTP